MNYLDWVNIFKNFSDLTRPPPINMPIHPPTHQTIHPPMGGNSPQISNLQTESKHLDLLKCYGIFTDSSGAHPLGGWWLGGLG